MKTFYAAQEVKLPQLTLKELICLPERAGQPFRDTQVAAALYKAGLGEFIEYLDAESREGKIWDQVLSGGQKQNSSARILLHQPGLLFLDEASSALDPEAKVAFHQAIKDSCPSVTVISVMHEAIPPRSAAGASFYDTVLTLGRRRGDEDAAWHPQARYSGQGGHRRSRARRDAFPERAARRLEQLEQRTPVSVPRSFSMAAKRLRKAA